MWPWGSGVQIPSFTPIHFYLTMIEFNFYWPTRFVFGRAKIRNIGKLAREMGGKMLLVTGRSSMRRTGILDMVINSVKSSGVEVVLFEGIGPNPKAELIDEGGKIAKDERCEFVTGIGGGSVMDAAKGIAISATHLGSIWEYINSFSEFKEVTSLALPLMEVPTVAGTGSEGNGTTVITNEKTHEKSFVKSEFIFPKVSIIDPELTLSVPPEITGECGVDIICHVLEPYLTATSQFSASFRITEAIIKVVVESLPVAVKDGSNINARENLSWAATLACSPFRGLGLSGTGPLHHIEHAVSGWFDISHGAGLCALLPHWLEYIADDISERLREFGMEIFGEEDAIRALRKWIEGMGIYKTLGELGVDKKLFNQMAVDTIRVCGRGEDFILGGTRKLFVNDITRIYENAF